jgi:hypothetical protein
MKKSARIASRSGAARPRTDNGGRVDTVLRRVKRGGETVTWDVSFRVNRPDRHYYLDVFGIWNDAGGRAYGDAYWGIPRQDKILR